MPPQFVQGGNTLAGEYHAGNQAMKRSRVLLLILLSTAGLIGLAIGLNGWVAGRLARHWQQQLDTVPDDRAAALLNRVGNLGRPGIAVLAEALGSDRPSVADAAKRELRETLVSYETLRAAESSPNLAILADALAQRVDSFGPAARCDAADLAARILSWPLDSKTVNRSQVIASCERVLRSTRLEGDRPPRPLRRNVFAPLASDSHRLSSASTGRDSEPSSSDSEPPEPASDQPPSTEAASVPGDNIAQIARLPGGGLPIESLSVPELPDHESAVPPLADARPAEPRPLSVTPDAQPLKPKDASTDSADDEKADPASRSGSGLARTYSSTLKRLKTVELMRNLRGGESRRATGSRDELVRRGFSEIQLDLARRAFDPDPEVRRQLARSMPALRSVNPAPWLMLLSRDADADVRLLAITLLATTADPAVLEQVEQLARKDSDSRVRRQAERISQRGRSTLH